MEPIDPKALQENLKEASRRIEAARDKTEVNAIVEKLMADLVDSEYASLWIFDEQRGTLVRERDDDSLNEISIQEQQGIIARCFLTMSGGIFNYLASEKEYVARYDNPDNIRIKSKLIVPIVDGERFLGLATAYSSVRRIRNFTEEDLKLMEAMVPFLIQAIYRLRPELREDHVERVYLDESLRAGARAVEEKVQELRQEESKREQESREAPDAMLGFLANTVHDIRTPANSLYGFLELLEARVDDARLLQYIRNAKESAQFINELTTSILDHVSLKFGGEREPVAVNPIKFFSDIASTFSANMFDKRIHYNIFLDPRLPAEIKVDAFRLKRVVLNLIGNAWKFTPKGRSIDLTVEYDPRTARMSVAVADKGIGIAKEKQEKIFEAFGQAEENTALEYGGTGLGLSISAQFVAAMGGKLRLESELEKGSRFFFDIPVEVVEESSRFPVLAVVPSQVEILMAKEHSEAGRNLVKYLLRLGMKKEQIRVRTRLDQIDPQSRHLIVFSSLAGAEELQKLRSRGMEILVMEEELFSLTGKPEYADLTVASVYGNYLPELYGLLSRGAGESRPSRKVLVVDDNRINIELLRALLEEELYKVETAENGEEGLRLLRHALERGEPFSLAFVDRHLPGMDGPELMERYRAEEKNRGGRRLFAVSITGDPQESESERRHFDRIMRKPFNRHEVKTILNELEG